MIFDPKQGKPSTWALTQILGTVSLLVAGVYEISFGNITLVVEDEMLWLFPFELRVSME